MKTYKAIMHFNKPGAGKGTPWTVHFRGVCHLVAAINCTVPMVSEFKPEKKQNPRAFFTAKVSKVTISDNGVATLE